MYYANKIQSLQDLFGTKDLDVTATHLRVGSRRYPIIEDVIMLLDQSPQAPTSEFAPDIQQTFGDEWKAYGGVLAEHEAEFKQYFDLVDLETLRQARVCDLGCGSGRWSTFLKDRCRELVLVDFSEAIFMARKNLAGCDRALFFHGDLKNLPFRESFADFLFSLGVLHHLPTPCLDEVRALYRAAPRLLIFLYYALDNRPFYFRWILGAVTLVRNVACRISSKGLRTLFSKLGTWGVYVPLVGLGHVLQSVGMGRFVPLYDFYRGKSVARIEQDVYDRFFTRIEQRVTKKEILTLRDTFSRVTISENLPYWHFLCER